MSRGPYSLVVLVAAVCVLAAVTTPILDPDLWQHLLVGKYMWATHSVPHTQLWSWPTYGAPDVLPSWLFRVLLYPFWEALGVHGLFVWRWLSTLAAFALLLAVARRMGATGAAPLLMLVWCALFWRQRSQVRPETLAAILLAAELLLLETRRVLGSRAHPLLVWGLVPIALLWANAHISYYLGFVVGAGYLLDDLVRRKEGRDARALFVALLACALASLVNPFGWRALAQPFEYFLVWRHEPIYKSIGELSSVDWLVHLRDGLPLWLALVVVAALVRWRRRGFDAAQAVVLAYFLPQAILSQRFLGYAAIAVAPFAARDAADALGSLRWPAVFAAPWRRALIAAGACVALALPTLTSPVAGFGYGFTPGVYPERACDWMAQHDVRGHGFHPFHFGGYLLWRFHPEADRLPFMDIHQAGTKQIRYIYAYAWQDSNAWREADRLYQFDWLMLPRRLPGERDLLDFVDDDSTWALVFADDAAALWLRRDGRAAAQARAHAYSVLPGGEVALARLGQRAWEDSSLRAAVRREAALAIASSPHNSRAHMLAGNVELQDGRFAEARAHFESAVASTPFEPGLHEPLGMARLMSGDAAGALAAFRTERSLAPTWPAADLREGQAFAALGRRAEARAAYERSLRRHPEINEASDSLASPALR